MGLVAGGRRGEAGSWEEEGSHLSRWRPEPVGESGFSPPDLIGNLQEGN